MQETRTKPRRHSPAGASPGDSLMIALSVRQPWAWSILTGAKDHEYRTWPTTYRGPLAVHAGVSKDDLIRGWRDVVLTEDGRTAGELLGFGAIVGVVDVTGC